MKLKIIQFYNNEKQLIKKAAKQNREAQKLLYEKHAPLMLSVCRRYVKDLQHAEEVMLNGFLKVFTNLKTYAFEGSFEGWVRKIMVNEAINFLKRNKNIFLVEDKDVVHDSSWNNIYEQISVDQIQELIDGLPNGYRMVFVLYAIEGYKHQEIANMLSISESTSKSQLFKARKLLQQKINELNTISHGAVKI